MTNWTLNPTITFDRPSEVSDTLDLIRLAEVHISLVSTGAHTEGLQVSVRVQYGLMDNGFKVYNPPPGFDENVTFDTADSTTILTTQTTSGNIASNMESSIWDRLEANNQIPPGTR
ncbi:MAG: hypothetical protein ACR2RF_25500 [Geminicoccaceae bacterium]